MIQTLGVSKRFEDVQAVNSLSMEIHQGEVFGLVGTNGAGKSTLLRMLCGILRQDEGSITVDGQPVYEDEAVKQEIFYISDDSYYFTGSTPVDMERYYKQFYHKLDSVRFYKLLLQFGLDKKRKIRTFSKGMKKQLSAILGICANTKYLLCDETFDGLDPVMRQAVKGIFATEVMEREFTPVIASHNLRELEDICKNVGLLHKGGILLSENLENMKLHLHKVQCVIPEEEQEKQILRELDVIRSDHQGSLLMVTARGTRSEIMKCIQEKNPLFCEILPLTLEEIFISETEVAGYEVKNLIF